MKKINISIFMIALSLPTSSIGYDGLSELTDNFIQTPQKRVSLTNPPNKLKEKLEAQFFYPTTRSRALVRKNICPGKEKMRAQIKFSKISMFLASKVKKTRVAGHTATELGTYESFLLRKRFTRRSRKTPNIGTSMPTPKCRTHKNLVASEYRSEYVYLKMEDTKDCGKDTPQVKTYRSIYVERNTQGGGWKVTLHKPHPSTGEAITCTYTQDNRARGI